MKTLLYVQRLLTVFTKGALESCRSQPNQGFYMHPATLDGTIHVLGATMVGWEAPLKIFSGMGRVQSHVHRNFSREERSIYYIIL